MHKNFWSDLQTERRRPWSRAKEFANRSWETLTPTIRINLILLKTQKCYLSNSVVVQACPPWKVSDNQNKSHTHSWACRIKATVTKPQARTIKASTEWRTPLLGLSNANRTPTPALSETPSQKASRPAKASKFSPIPWISPQANSWTTSPTFHLRSILEVQR